MFEANDVVLRSMKTFPLLIIGTLFLTGCGYQQIPVANKATQNLSGAIKKVNKNLNDSVELLNQGVDSAQNMAADVQQKAKDVKEGVGKIKEGFEQITE
jgi:hypothetical protein